MNSQSEATPVPSPAQAPADDGAARTDQPGGLLAIRRAVPRGLVPGIFTPGELLVRAAVLAGLFAVGHLLGWRSATSIISGTFEGGKAGDPWVAFKGIYYLVTYFGFVLGTPILAMTAGFMLVLSRFVAPGTPQAMPETK